MVLYEFKIYFRLPGLKAAGLRNLFEITTGLRSIRDTSGWGWCNVLLPPQKNLWVIFGSGKSPNA